HPFSRDPGLAQSQFTGCSEWPGGRATADQPARRRCRIGVALGVVKSPERKELVSGWSKQSRSRRIKICVAETPPRPAWAGRGEFPVARPQQAKGWTAPEPWHSGHPRGSKDYSSAR